MAKVIYKMLPWPTNTFGPRRKSIIWVKIDPWPRFGHIFVHNTFSKLPKITWKWRISIESQAGSISYQKALAKGQHEMKNQSFSRIISSSIFTSIPSINSEQFFKKRDFPFILLKENWFMTANIGFVPSLYFLAVMMSCKVNFTRQNYRNFDNVAKSWPGSFFMPF